MTATTAITAYAPGQAVMVQEEPHRPDTWAIGMVTRPTDPEYGWTSADVRTSPNCTSSMVPGYDPGSIRPATEQDIAALPDWAREWIEQQLLDHHNPRVPGDTKVIRVALRDAGIHRLADLQRATDAELLALKGVGAKAVATLRQWQQKREAKLQGARADG